MSRAGKQPSCVYYIGGPFDLVKRVEDIFPGQHMIRVLEPVSLRTSFVGDVRVGETADIITHVYRLLPLRGFREVVSEYPVFIATWEGSK